MRRDCNFANEKGGRRSAPASSNQSAGRRGGLGFLDPEGLVAAAALLADDRKRSLQCVEVVDLALVVSDHFGKACNVLGKARFVAPDLVRRAVVTLERLALQALGEQGWQLLGGIFELR